VLLVAHREQRLLERPPLDTGEEFRELVTGGQERFLVMRTGAAAVVGAMLYQNTVLAPSHKPEKT